MFITNYTRCPLATPAAEELFGNIKCESFRNDATFLAFMRVLLKDRLPEGATANVYLDTGVDKTIINGKDADSEDLMSAIIGCRYNPKKENVVNVVSFSTSNENDRKNLAEFFSVKSICGMGEEPAVNEAILCKAFPNGAKCFIDFKTSRCLIVAFSEMNIALWHACAVLTTRIFKRYFEDAGKPKTEWESENIIGGLLAEKTSDKFAHAVIEFASKIDFRTPTIKLALNGFETKNERQRLQRLSSQIEDMIRRINDDVRRYTEDMKRKATLEEQKAGIMFQKIDENASPLMDYFLANDKLFISEFDENQVTFCVKTVLGNFNEDFVKNILENRERNTRVDLYTSAPRSISREDKDLLFKAIFIDKIVKVWLFGKFTIYNNQSNPIQAHSGFDVPIEMSDCCPNPHLYQHACMGGNSFYATDAFLSGEYALGMEQTIGSVASVNLTESATAPRWMADLFSDKYGKFFEVDGQRMNYTNLITYLKTNKKEAIK